MQETLNTQEDNEDMLMEDREAQKKSNVLNNQKIMSKTSWDKHFTRNKTRFQITKGI